MLIHLTFLKEQNEFFDILGLLGKNNDRNVFISSEKGVGKVGLGKEWYCVRTTKKKLMSLISFHQWAKVREKANFARVILLVLKIHYKWVRKSGACFINKYSNSKSPGSEGNIIAT